LFDFGRKREKRGKENVEKILIIAMCDISVIVTVYNAEKYISRCLSSILNQSYGNIEVIVVDDHSIDNSKSVIKRFVEQDKRVRLLENEENCGPAWSRKRGYEMASGKYYIFCDSDDWLPANALETLYDAMTSNSASIVIGDFCNCTDVNVVKSSFKNVLRYGTDKVSVFKSLLLREVLHSLSGKMFDAKLFGNHDFNEKKGFTNSEDAFLFYQLVDNSTKVIAINEFVYCYFENAGSLSRRRLSDNALDCMAIAICKIKNIVSVYSGLRDLLDQYIAYAVFQWMLPGSCSFVRTFKVLKKHHLHKYLSLRYCFDKSKLNIRYIKNLIKSI
jgi:glycosyltransferase involved in cell wall biosynthesis